ncbi:MAG: YfhO family protein [Sediminicola sp.]
MNSGTKAIFVHFFVSIFFVVIALAYFHPVLQGKVIYQSDIVWYTGMAKEQNDFRKGKGEEPYWTNSAFGGMPTYQLGANYPHNYTKKLDGLIRFLPRPADYLFLYFIGFYILLCCLKVDYRLAVLGSLAFGFSTYLIVILGVGHNAKAHAIGYLPLLLSGIVLTFRHKYLWGFIVTAIGMALEVNANHYQMTYYFMLLVLVLGLVHLVDAIRKGAVKKFFVATGILLGAVLLGIAANATSLLATKQYADWSTRGPSELTIRPDGSPKNNTDGLDREYITQYSYGIVESLNLFVPRLFGGSGGEDLGTDSKTFSFLTERGLPRTQALEFGSNLPLYWGEQPFVGGPAYIGAIVVFLFLLGLLLVKGKVKWWLLGGTLMALVLSWGKNFKVLTDLMIDYFPLYDKFRAVSSIQVILELCAPILAFLALRELFKKEIPTAEKIRGLKIAGAIAIGVLVILLLVKGMFHFEGPSDGTFKQYYGEEFVKMIQLDRQAVYTSDIFRSLIYVILSALAIWLYIKSKIKETLLTVVLATLLLFDLVGVALRYVNESDFVPKRAMEKPFQETEVDRQIFKDKGIYRVYDPSEGVNGSRTSYFHKSIGGYHAAKPAGLQELFDYHIYNNNVRVLNMLNVKYVIQEDGEGKKYAAENPYALGNAWFVGRLVPVKSANAEMRALDSLDVQNEAVVNTTAFPGVNTFTFTKDSTASIELTEYLPNKLTYVSNNPRPGMAVFSEMYYARGWNAYLDGKAVPHIKVNHVLRALQLPQGKHTITFKFEPKVVERGGAISLASSILLGLFIIGALGMSIRNSIKKKRT